MSEKETNTNVELDSSVESSDHYHHDDSHLELKKHSPEEIAASGKWYDRRFIRGIPQYSDSMVQIVMLSFVVFMTPGMYNALSGIGGAGISDRATADNANVALYSCFATIGFFAGTICNYFGIKACLIGGGTGYFLYSSSLLCFYHTENKGFVIFSGAYLGICASCLWAAQGTIIMSYPTEDKKGRAIMIFWVIFNLGAVIGSVIPLANNINNKGSAVGDSTYIAFMVLMFCGSLIAMCMLPMNKVWKSDGTRVMNKKFPSWKKELIDLYHMLISEPRIFFVFPMFFASNWFYTYQFNDFNAGRFNIRTRSLNSLLYWLSQMFGAIIFGSILDLKCFRRSTRAKIGYIILTVISLAIWGGGLKFQLGFTREDVTSPDAAGEIPPKFAPIDFEDGSYIGPMFLYIFYGIFDSMFQTYLFWILGSMSNNPKKTALYAGFYKGLQSAGAAIAWRLDALEKPYMDLFASSWGLVNGSLLIALPLIWFKITDHTDIEKDGLTEVVTDNEIKSVKSFPQEGTIEVV